MGEKSSLVMGKNALPDLLSIQGRVKLLVHIWVFCGAIQEWRKEAL